MAFWISWEKVQCCKISGSASLVLRTDPYLWNSFSSLKTVLDIKTPMLWSKDRRKKKNLLIPNCALNLPALCKGRDSSLMCNGLSTNTRQQSSAHFSNFLFKKEAIISPCGRDPLSQRACFCCWHFHHSSSHNKIRDGRSYHCWAPWLGAAPSRVFKVTFGQLCPEAALACGWCGVHGAFPSVWNSFLKYLEGNSVLANSFFLLGCFESIRFFAVEKENWVV